MITKNKANSIRKLIVAIAIVLFLCLVFVSLGASENGISHTLDKILFKNSNIVAYAAEIPKYLKSSQGYNYSYNSIEIARTFTIADTSGVEQNSINASNSNYYIFGGMSDPPFQAVDYKSTGGIVQFVRVKMSSEMILAMQAGLISDIKITADSPKLSVPAYWINSGTMRLAGFAALVPAGTSNNILGASATYYQNQEVPEATAPVQRGNFVSSSMDITLNRDMNFRYASDIIIGWVGVFDRSNSYSVKCDVQSMTKFKVSVTYEAPTVELEPLSNDDRAKGLKYVIAGTSDTSFFSDEDHINSIPFTLDFGVTNITISVVTQGSFTDSAKLFDKFTYTYTASNGGDYFQQNNAANGKKLNVSNATARLTFSYSSLSPGTHKLEVSSAEIKIAGETSTDSGSTFTYKQSQAPDYQSIRQGPHVYLEGKRVPISGTVVDDNDPQYTNKYQIRYDSASTNVYKTQSGSSYSNSLPPKDAGDYKLEFNVIKSGAANNLLASRIVFTFNIKKIDLSAVTGRLQNTIESYIYNGKSHTPAPTEVYFQYDASNVYKLKAGIDYDISSLEYANNVNAYPYPTDITDLERAPKVVVKGKGNFNNSAGIGFNINSLQINANSPQIVAIGERGTIDSNALPLSKEITAFYDTKAYAMFSSGSQEFPKPRVDYLRFGWAENMISEQNSANERFFFVSEYYGDTAANSPFNENIEYAGYTFNKYRTESTSMTNNPDNPETNSAWARAARYKIVMSSYEWKYDATKRISYGEFKINFDAVYSKNIIGSLTVRYEIPSRDLNKSTVKVTKHPNSSIYRGEAISFKPNSISIEESEVNVWVPVYENEVIQYYEHQEQVLTYTLYPIDANVTGITDPIHGFFDIIPTSKGYNTNVINNLAELQYFNTATYTEVGNYFVYNLSTIANQDINTPREKLNFLYSGKVRLHFDIVPKGFSDTDTTIASGDTLNNISVVYNSMPLSIPNLNVNDRVQPVALTSGLRVGIDYSVEYENNINVTNSTSMARIKVTGMGNYKDTVEKTFSILPRNIDNNIVDSILLEDQIYTGNLIIPQVLRRLENGDAVTGFTLRFLDQFPSQYQVNDHSPLLSKTFNIDSSEDNQVFAVLDPSGQGNSGNNIAASSSTNNFIKLNIIAGNFRGVVKASFNILPKNLSSESIEIVTSWKNTHPNLVTYTSLQIANLPIVANQASSNTIVVSDTEIVGPNAVLVYGQLSSSGADYYISSNSWGENINAGETAGTLKIYGKGNYTGYKIATFEILPKDLSSGQNMLIVKDESEAAGFNPILSGYIYTGQKITPTILSLKNTGIEGWPELVQGTDASTPNVDYIVRYSEEPDSDNNGYNYSVIKGGKIIIEGIGNYTGQYTSLFKIVPKNQNVSLEILPSTDQTNANYSLKSETIATNKADLEINAERFGYVIVNGYTTAIYPSPRKVHFKLLKQNGGPSDLALESQIIYDSCEIVEVSGVQLAKTTAKIYFASGKFGIVRIVAEQEDGEGIIENKQQDGNVGIEPYYRFGNYYSFTQSSGSQVQFKRLYMKREDKANGFANRSVTYGNDIFEINHGLLSSIKNKAFNIEISDSSIISLVDYQAGSSSYKFIVNKAGIANLVLSHNGFVDANDESFAYVSFRKTVSITVKKRDLMISFIPLTVVYGTQEDVIRGQIQYLFTTSALEDSYTGIAYGGGKKDLPEEIISGLIINYSAQSYSNVNIDPNTGEVIPYSIYVTVPSNAQTGTKFQNYNLRHQENNENILFPGELTVAKKLLTVDVEINSEYGTTLPIFSRDYGKNNPAESESIGDYKFKYSGFVAGETYGDMLSGQFVAPTLQYKYWGDENGNPIDINDPIAMASKVEHIITKTTKAGSYNIWITEGKDENYEMRASYKFMLINKASVNINLVNKTTIYNGQVQEASLPEVTGFEPGNYPIGYSNEQNFSYKYKYNGEGFETTLGPTNQGKHTVIVMFHADDSDNYKDTRAVFVGALQIQKALPTILMDPVSIQYKDGQIAISDLGLGARVQGVPGGSLPLPNVIGASSYRFKLYQDSDSNYTPTWPQSQGKYDIEITYSASVSSNYTDTTKEFSGILEITQRDVYIKATSLSKSYTSFGNPYTLANIKGYESSLISANELLPKSDGIKLQYFVAGANEPLPGVPRHAGTYDINVSFNPQDTNYRLTQKRFASLFTITRYDLYADNKDTALDYPGIKQVDYNGKSQAFPSQNIKLKRLPADTGDFSGTIIVEYVRAGQTLAVSTPIDSGSYKVVINYIPSENDNYTLSKKIEFANKIIIDKISPIFPANVTLKEVDFSGYGHSINVTLTGISREIEGVLINDVLKGNITYEYKVSGQPDSEYTEAMPIVTGLYDVRISYANNISTLDNYQTSLKNYTGVLEIRKVSPTLRLKGGVNRIEMEYGEVVVAVVEATGVTLSYPPSTVSNSIQVQFTKTKSDNTEEVILEPTESGLYNIKALYQPPVGENNYKGTSYIEVGKLFIKNIKPEIALENLVQVYTGQPIVRKEATITNLDGKEAKGTFIYRYKHIDSAEFKTTLPLNAGIYDVEVEYREKHLDDNFSNTRKVFAMAIKIIPLEIEVEAVYGQGKTFDGMVPNSEDILYLYKYEKNGIVYYQYSNAKNTAGDKYDLRNAIYYAQDGYGYTIDTLNKNAYRDYKIYPLSYTEYGFSVVKDGSVFFERISNTSAQTEFVHTSTIMNGRYYIDTINNIAYSLNPEKDVFVCTEVNAKFFSVLNQYGKTLTIRINEGQINQYGEYKVIIDGVQRTFRVNLNDMVVRSSDNQKTYPIFSRAGEIRKPLAQGSYDVLYFDYNNLVKAKSKDPIFMLYASDGYIYNVSKTKNIAKRMHILEKEQVIFTVEDTTITAEKSNLNHLYGSIYSFTNNSLTYEIDLANGFARISSTTKYQDDGAIRFSDGENNIYLDLTDLMPTKYANLAYATYTTTNTVYYFNTLSKAVYREDAIGKLNIEADRIEYTNSESILLNSRYVLYKLYRGTILVDESSLFDKKLAVTKPGLIHASDIWTSSGADVNLEKAGTALIDTSLVSVCPNYTIVHSSNKPHYIIDKAIVYVIFTPPTDNVYSGGNKTITYEFLGLVGSEGISFSQISQSYEGDRVNATLENEQGYRMQFAISNPNYIILTSGSPWYKIEFKTMETYSQNEIVESYTGRPYKLAVNGLDNTYTISYEEEGIPTFIEPGRYEVTAIISKLNYKPQTVRIGMNIKKAIFREEPNSIDRTCYYGDPLPKLTSPTTLGKFEFAHGVYLDPLVSKYKWKFVPNDSNFYSRYEGLPENNYVIEGYINIKVERAPAKIVIEGPLSQNISSPASLLPKIDGKVVPMDKVKITYESSDGYISEKMPSAPGRYKVRVLYLGDEKYAASEYTTELIIKGPPNLTWLWVTLGIIAGLAMISTIFFLVKKKKVYR